jgi:hypothetical protein
MAQCVHLRPAARRADTRPLVRRIPGHRAHDRFTTRFPDTSAAGVGPVPPGTDPRADRPCDG